MDFPRLGVSSERMAVLHHLAAQGGDAARGLHEAGRVVAGSGTEEERGVQLQLQHRSP